MYNTIFTEVEQLTPKERRTKDMLNLGFSITKIAEEEHVDEQAIRVRCKNLGAKLSPSDEFVEFVQDTSELFDKRSTAIAASNEYGVTIPTPLMMAALHGIISFPTANESMEMIIEQHKIPTDNFFELYTGVKGVRDMYGLPVLSASVIGKWVGWER